MQWTKVTIDTTSAGIEPVTGQLYEMGIQGLQIEDQQDFAEFLEHNAPYWDLVDQTLADRMEQCETKVIFYLEEDETLPDRLSAVRDAVAALRRMDQDGMYGRLEVESEGVQQEDWANNWRQYFKPLPVGKRVLIQPEWEPGAETGGRVVFRIEPGMTFGTGTHQSTQLCIKALEDILSGGERVLDIGCGTGILSIIALLLGADTAVALDVDPAARHVAYENAARNGIGRDRYTVLCGDILADGELQQKISGKYDVVAANIVADVIIALLPLVQTLLKEDGTFLCSGILDERLPDVLAAMDGSCLTVQQVQQDGCWAAVTCKFCEMA